MRLARIAMVAKQTIKKTVLGGTALVIGLSGLVVAGPLFLSSPAYAASPIVINEISPASTTEWVELYNPSATSMDISSWQVKDNANHILGTVPLSTAIPAYGYYVITGSNTLNNTGGDSAILLDSSSSTIDRVAYGSDFTSGEGSASIPTSTQSLARTTNGGNTWAIGSPTQGVSNDPTAELSVCPVNCDYTTVGAAISAISSGGTIRVNSGNYSTEGTLSINKAVSLLGASATISDASIGASNVIIDGFTFNKPGIQVNISSPTALSGLQITHDTFNGYSGTGLTAYDAGNILIKNNTFSNAAANTEAIQLRASSVQGGCSGAEISYNTFTNATNNGAADVNLSCTDSNSSNITVSHNTSTGVSGGSSFTALSGIDSNITISNNTAATDGSSVFFFGNVSGSASITNNTFSSSLGSAVSIHGGDITSDTANSGTFTITSNTLSGSLHSISVASGSLIGSLTAHSNNLSSDSGTAVVNNSSVVIDATLNYWGSVAPSTSGSVTVSPYFTNSGMTIRSDAKVLPDNSGNASVNSSTPQVVVTSSSQALNITVSSGTSSPSINFSSLVSNGATTSTATLPQTTINSNTATVSIPASTVVTANSASWNGIVNAPTVQTNTSVPVPTPSGYDTTLGTVINVGSDSVDLSFSNAVRLLIPGQANQLVGFVKDGAFTQITTSCNTDTQAVVDAQLPADGACYINVGSDMVIWTKHFTQFVTYSQAPVVATPSSTITTASVKKTNTTSSAGQSSSSEVLGSSTATPNTAVSSTSTTRPTVAAAATTPKSGKLLGVEWYLWVIALAALAVAGYSAHYIRSSTTPSKK